MDASLITSGLRPHGVVTVGDPTVFAHLVVFMHETCKLEPPARDFGYCMTSSICVKTNKLDSRLKSDIKVRGQSTSARWLHNGVANVSSIAREIDHLRRSVQPTEGPKKEQESRRLCWA